MTSTSPLVVEFKQFQSPYLTSLKWVSNNGEGVLYDVLEPGNINCYKGSCDDNDPNNRTRVLPDGELNDDGEEGQFDEQFDDKNISIYENAPERQKQNEYNKKEGVLNEVNIIKQVNALSIEIPKLLNNKIKYSIFNSLGQLIIKENVIINNQMAIDFNQYSSGIYILVLETETNKKTIKFIHEQ
jgi:hypothetical protein